MKSGSIYAVADWKMKWIPTNWDETAKKWFGKRGIIWHGFSISIPKEVWDASSTIEAVLKEKDPEEVTIEPLPDGSYLLYVHDVFQNDHKVDGSTTLTSIEGLVKQLQEWFPSCSSWVLQTDNGPCYKSNVFAMGLQRLNESYRLKMKAFINTGVQDGKTNLDGHFGVLTQGLIQQMVLFKDMNSPDTLVAALRLLAPANCIIRMVTVDRDAVKRIHVEAEENKKYFVPNVSDIRHFENVSVEGISCWAG